jgi:3-hydroxyisobutyrate dehydrogenase
MARVAFLGLGGMGSRMARRLVGAGHETAVWNRTATKADPLIELGARGARDPADAVGGAEVVITMLATPDALRAVTEGPNGAASAIVEGATLIEMSTVGPGAVERLASALPAGVGLLDAPVLGSLPEAEAGTLRIFVGGPAELAGRWMPLLATMGTPTPVGALGMGAAAKLVANLTLYGTLGVLGEALALARAVGLPLDTTFDVLSGTPLGAQADRRRPAIESGTYEPRFPLRLALKDADLISLAAADAPVELPVTEAARSWLAAAAERGLGEQDYSTVLALIMGGVP